VKELKNGDEKLFEQIFLSQFETNLRFLQKKYSIQRETAYDICMDTIIEFRRLLIQEKIGYGNLKSLFTTISSQKYIRYAKKNGKTVSSEHIPELRTEELNFDQDELQVLDRAWSKLGSECQSILKKYYYQNHKLYDIAEELGKSAAALRKQKERCINALKMNFHQIKATTDEKY